MLRAAIIFFILGIVGFFFGLNGIAGMSVEIGQILLAVFLVIAVISLVTSIVTGKKHPLP